MAEPKGLDMPEHRSFRSGDVYATVRGSPAKRWVSLRLRGRDVFRAFVEYAASDEAAVRAVLVKARAFGSIAWADLDAEALTRRTIPRAHLRKEATDEPLRAKPNPSTKRATKPPPEAARPRPTVEPFAAWWERFARRYYEGDEKAARKEYRAYARAIGAKPNPMAPGRAFVIVDTSEPGGRWVDRTIYKTAASADRAAAKLEAQGAAVQVIDALWYEPARAVLRAQGAVANPKRKAKANPPRTRVHLFFDGRALEDFAYAQIEGVPLKGHQGYHFLTSYARAWDNAEHYLGETIPALELEIHHDFAGAEGMTQAQRDRAVRDAMHMENPPRKRRGIIAGTVAPKPKPKPKRNPSTRYPKGRAPRSLLAHHFTEYGADLAAYERTIGHLESAGYFVIPSDRAWLKAQTHGAAANPPKRRARRPLAVGRRL
jgi:hypothetical protein